jgi:hypothetical protein
MPFSYAQFTGDGSNRQFSVTFPFILRAHVKVYTAYDLATQVGTELVDGVDFAWLSDTLIETTVAPTLGQNLTVIRRTPSLDRLVVWQSGSPPTPTELNLADLQNFYLTQEQADFVGVGIITAQLAVDSANLALSAANAALVAASAALPYGPILNVASIPGAPTPGQRIEILDSTDIQSFTPLTGIPGGFIGSSQIKVRLVYAEPLSGTWNWFDYSSPDPDGRYLQKSSLSSSASSPSTTVPANSAAVKTAKDAADAAQNTADAAGMAADAAAATANSAVAGALFRSGGMMTGAITHISEQPGLGRKNLLINPNFLINQRNYSSGAATSGANQYTVDRWRVVTSGQSLSWTASNGVRTATAPAGGLEQVIEGASLLPGTYVINWTGTATCTVGGISRAKGATFTIAGGADVTVRFTGGTVSLPQLEMNAVPTMFEGRHVGEEFNLCARYYLRPKQVNFNSNSNGTAGTQGFIYCFPTEMRTSPVPFWTVATASGNLASFNIDSATPYSARIIMFSAGAGNYSADYNGTTGYIDFTAEL